MTANNIKLSIFRYDPARDKRPYYENYRVPSKLNMTILDSLVYVYENLDGTLAFNYGCRYGSCGTCAMKVNGKPKLVCKELALPEMRIEPLSNFRIIRDLVVDRNSFYSKSKRIRPFLERGTEEVIQPERLNPLKFGGFRHVYQCIECMSCDSVCPAMTEDPFSFSGPALFVQMARQMLDTRDQLDRSTIACSEGLYHCLRCGSCTEACPYSIDVPGLVIKRIREMASAKGALPHENKNMIREIVEHGKPFPIKKPPKSSLISQMPQLTDRKGVKGDVALFLGCNIEYNPRLLQTGKSGFDVLRKEWNVKVPDGLQCCGLPLLEIGAMKEFIELVRNNVRLLEASGVRDVVTLCPGCTMTMKNDWAKIYEETEGRRPKFRVHDFIEFLSSRMETKKVGKLPLRVTYHEPCHSNRFLGFSKKARALITGIPGVELVEMEEPDRCCGGGGGVMTVNPDLAITLANKKVDMVRNIEVDAVVTNCPTCIIQIGRSMSMRKVKGIQTLHVATLFDMAYGNLK
jgi:fumarate reductase (CoM/CoB) subunit B